MSKILRWLLSPPQQDTAQVGLRHYNNGDAEFILEPVNEWVVKVTHRNQVGWIGVSVDWDPLEPYTYTTFSSRLKDDGIDPLGFAVRHP